MNTNDQENRKRSLAHDIRILKATAAKEGLEIRQIISVLEDCLDEEKRLLVSQKADERSY